MEINFEELYNVFKAKSAWDSNYKKEYTLFNGIKKLIDVEAIKAIYPKNLFVEEENLKVIILTDTSICLFELLDSNKLNGFCTSRGSIGSLNIDMDCEYRGNNQLEIKFYDKESIILNGEKDTNEYYRDKMNEKIREIFKELS
ncbi:DUF3908 family protein [Clostridium botulinum]|uniref:DUF3908 family protein n=1 Tax=Clostridium botulinum TaxID=1491 RepID=UPI0004DA9843|nr:DUF3908 family protein [Clostridium botulinum]KEH96156.1 hypothetical protein Z953_p0221 [Clostridium botulinum D str. 16868]MCD3202867.1 DUF3908 family protein [Clostridium botulinum C/D]MCD3230846.1 DUF3908 family protein [Clostridium botulinum C/D]MCD3253969.1 DUF3908 family protein [Clostridium botulinum C/D]MCD3279435.1 DUF3908 family protein [Clostridium botulinum C/D]